MYRLFIIKLLCFIALFSTPIGLNLLFLYNTGELVGLGRLAAQQTESNSDIIAGFATRNLGYNYKKELYSQQKPNILILGSSRVLQLRAEFFTDSVLNAGSSMGSVKEGFNFLREVIKIHKPKTLILGVDYWWFDPNYATPSFNKQSADLDHILSFRSYLLPFRWIYDGKITPQEYMKNLRFSRSTSSLFGVDATLRKTGFNRDGSYFYYKTVTGKEKDYYAIGFKKSHQMLTLSNEKLSKTPKIDISQVELFSELIDYARQHDVEVVTFLTPIAPSLENSMQNYPNVNESIEQLKRVLRVHLPSINDYLISTVLNTCDCEYIDGIHGGDVTYAKLLLEMADHNTKLLNIVNMDYLRFVSSRYGGLAMIPRVFFEGQKEVDFLKLGCNKIYE